MTKFLHFFAPLISRIPEVNTPSKEQSFGKKLGLTLAVFLIFNLLTLLPVVYEDRDPYRFFRTFTSFPQFNLAVLGVLSMILAGLTLLSFQGLKIINIEWNNQEDRYLYNGTLKVLSLIFTVIGALLLIITGFFGEYLLLGDMVSIFIQLGFAGVLIVYLDETLKKGWGFGSGLSLFIGSVALSEITAGLFSVQRINEGSPRTISFEGLVPAFLNWIHKEGLNNAFNKLFIRYSTNSLDYLKLPNLSILSLLLTVLVASLVIILEFKRPKITFHNEIQRESYLTPLIPLLLVTFVLMIIRFALQFTISVFGIRGGAFIGMYEFDPHSGRYILTGGLLSFLLPPHSVIIDILKNPLMTLIRVLTFSYVFLFTFMKITNVMFKQMGFKSTNENTVLLKTRWTIIAVIAVCAEIFNPWGIGFLMVPLTLILIEYYRLFVESESSLFVNFDISLVRHKYSHTSDIPYIRGFHFWIMVGLISIGMFLLRFVLFTSEIRRTF